MADEITVQDKAPLKQNRWAKAFFLFSVLSIIIISIFAYAGFKLFKRDLSLTQQAATLQTQSQQVQSELQRVQQTVAALQQDLQKSKDLSLEQERLVAAWQAAQKGDLKQWQVAEAQYLVRLANDLLQFTGNTQTAAMLLERADQTLESQGDPQWFEIRKAIAEDLSKIKSLPKVDITGIYAQLLALNNQVKNLPFPEAPLQADQAGQDAPADPSAAWWQKGWDHTWQTLKKIVVVKKMGGSNTPLVFPDEKPFLYQNLHSQFDFAIWGLLHHQNEIYQNSLNGAENWIQTYFVRDATITQNMLQALTELKKINVELPSMDLTTTLQRFEAYFNVVRSEQTVQ